MADTNVHAQAFVRDDPLVVEVFHGQDIMIRAGNLTVHFMGGRLDTARQLRSLAQQAILAADLIAPPLSSEDAQDAEAGDDGLPDVPLADLEGHEFLREGQPEFNGAFR